MKAIARRPDGSVVMVLGLSQGNIDRMQEGESVYFDPATLRIAPGDTIAAITIFYGKDEGELARTIRTLIGPTTEVQIIPRGDRRPQ